MTGNDTSIAVHEERLNRHRGDLERSFQRIESLEGEQVERALNRVSDQARFEEMNTGLLSLKETIESALKITQREISSINERLNNFERERIDIIKVLKWLSTVRGTCFMIVVSGMLIGAIFPDAREWLSSLLGLTGKVKL